MARVPLQLARANHSQTSQSTTAAGVIQEPVQRAKIVMARGSRFIGFSLFWLNLLVSPQLLAESNPEKVYRKVLPAVMTLEVENLAGERFVGSAVLSLADDVATTAWHVVSDAKSVWAVFADGTRVRVEGCIDRDSQRDLALLKLERKLPGRKAALSRQRPAVATRAFVIGAPKGFGFSISDGLVSQVREIDGVSQYQLSCPISPGNSGGPVLNERAEVIGITSWTKADAQNLSFAIPSLDIPRLDATKPPVPWNRLAPIPPTSEVSSTATRSISSVPRSESKGASSPSFEEFAHRLERSVGKQVTVIVQEDGTENRYQFTVPGKALK